MSSFFDFNRPKMFDVKKKLGIVEKEEKNDTSSHGTFLLLRFGFINDSSIPERNINDSIQKIATVIKNLSKTTKIFLNSGIKNIQRILIKFYIISLKKETGKIRSQTSQSDSH